MGILLNNKFINMGSLTSVAKNGISKATKGLGNTASSSSRLLHQSGLQSLAANGSRNLDIGSKSTAIISECRDISKGMTNGDFKRVAVNAGILGLSALPGAGGKMAQTGAG